MQIQSHHIAQSWKVFSLKFEIHLFLGFLPLELPRYYSASPQVGPITKSLR